MDIRELRVNNWVIKDERYWQIGDSINSYIAENVKPIKINGDVYNEIKEKHIELDEDINPYTDAEIKIKLDQSIGAILTIEEKFFIQATYLHQLQNIYFDITRKELSINLTNCNIKEPEH